MKNETMQKLIEKADSTAWDDSEEMKFLEYQSTILQTKSAKRNRRLLIALSVAVYLLGLGIFATIVSTVYQMNETAGWIVGGILVFGYTVCFVVVLCSIFSRHSFDLEFRKRKNGHMSERHNNRVRTEIARNLHDQDEVIEYLEEKVEKNVLKDDEAREVESFENLLLLGEKYAKNYPDYRSADAKTLSDSLRLAYSKNGIIYKKAKRMILKRAIQTGTYTALSSSAIVDGSLVAVKNLQLVKDLIWLYGFRPTDSQMNRILLRVIRNVGSAVGMNAIPNVGKVFNKDSSNFFVSLLGQAISMGAQFVGNGVMTYLVGKYTLRVMMSEFHFQDLFRQSVEEDFRMEMDQSTFEEIDKQIEEELKDSPALVNSDASDTKAITDGKEKKPNFFKRIFKKKEKKEAN